jgi:hypothetical protein
LRWDGEPGHYEVYYLTTTDPQTGTGLWIRYTMVAQIDEPPQWSLWFMATFPDAPPIARKLTVPEARWSDDPFRLEIAGAVLDDGGMRGAFEDVAWDLTWEPGAAYEHVHPLIQRAKIAKTVLCLPHGDVPVRGTVTLPGGRTLTLDGVHGGQAHLWGSKHSLRWTWAHCGDFEGAPDTFFDGVSVYVPRFGREVGPSTPAVGRFLGEDFKATSPLAVLKAPSDFGLSTWTFEVRDGKRRVHGVVDAPRDHLVGVTYTDPDGEKAYCYNSEAATMRLTILDQAGRGWVERAHLESVGRAHFEYGQRMTVPDLELHLT